MADTTGFEPVKGISLTVFPGLLLNPLGQVSMAEGGRFERP